MARNTQLTLLIDMLRAEVGHSQSAASGLNYREGLMSTLRIRQERLYAAYEWEHLKVNRVVDLAVGSRTYAFPSDLNFERVSEAHYQSATGKWTPISYGIDIEQYNIVDSLSGHRRDRVERWGYEDPSMLEVWPIPATAGGKIRLHGSRLLRPLLADSDRCDLDDVLIVLFSAAHIMARQKDSGASLKLQEAQEHYLSLRGQPISAREMFILGGGEDPSESVYQSRELTV